MGEHAQQDVQQLFVLVLHGRDVLAGRAGDAEEGKAQSFQLPPQDHWQIAPRVEAIDAVDVGDQDPAVASFWMVAPLLD